MPRKTIPMAFAALLSLIVCQNSGCAATTDYSGNYMLDNGEKLLGNNNYPAISYSGHRKTTRTVENTPSLEETKEDMLILSAMGIRLLRTYNAREFPHAERTLQAIRELRQADPDFEMCVMLGAWIQCKNSNREGTDHSLEDADWNRKEIDTVIRLAKEYPDIVKIIAVGNEAMVRWQTHYVPAATILKWVNVLKEARSDGRIPANTLITSSDNWAALGGTEEYRNDDLAELMRQMDFISLHTYAFHDTFYNPALQWGPLPEEADLSAAEQAAKSVERSVDLQKAQYKAVEDYLQSIGVDKEIHIGETGWASQDNAHYGAEGTCAAYEYTSKLFYDAVMKWTRENDLTCFYFEAFDEPWKSKDFQGSESYFGLLTVDGKARYALWDLVDTGAFKGLQRGGNPITKTHGGDKEILLEKLKAPAHKKH
ncbi:hypothetical protein P4C99_02365 [Pontiellaceae bacterium B1224]|nr:hypothetical protein [Pontiellaceae bacterium B1224]